MSDQEVTIAVQQILDGAHLAEAMAEEHAALGDLLDDSLHGERLWPRLFAAHAAVEKALEEAREIKVTR